MLRKENAFIAILRMVPPSGTCRICNFWGMFMQILMGSKYLRAVFCVFLIILSSLKIFEQQNSTNDHPEGIKNAGDTYFLQLGPLTDIGPFIAYYAISSDIAISTHWQIYYVLY